MAELWWRDAVVYQVYPRSFASSGGSGEGDLRGIRSRLGYLSDLGVTAIWLNPFYPSPMHDSGYDVADYFDVDPRFGTLKDFDALVDAAGRVGIRVIIDIVPNHCSAAHPWFREALADSPDGAARERFVFRDQPNNWESHFGGPAWTQVPDGQWYLHLFDSSQPDFNWRHSDVVAMFERVLRFWLDRGVAAIRIDMANTLYKEAELPDLPPNAVSWPYYHQPEIHELYRSWRAILDSYPAEEFPSPRGAVAEIWFSHAEEVLPYLTAEGLPQTFNFRLMRVAWAARELRSVIDEARDMTRGCNGSMPWVLGNHDVTRLVSRLGVDQNLIRVPTDEWRRGTAYVDVAVGTQRARAAALLLLALPGSAYIYQGDELGLPEHFDIPANRREDPTFRRTGGAAVGRDGCRIPMPWSGTAAPFGFTREPVRTWLPQPDWSALTVEAQSAKPDSMLNLYRAALRLRHGHPALGGGDLEWLDLNDEVLVFRREPNFLFVLNLGDEAVPLPPEHRILLASGPMSDGPLPTDTAVWLTS